MAKHGMTFPDLGPFIDDADKTKRNKGLAIVVFILFMACITLVGTHLLFESIAPENQETESWQILQQLN